MASEGDAGSWMFAAIGTGAAAFIGSIYQFYKGRKDASRLDHTVIVEAGEIADMADVRQLAKDFRPALEKLHRIDMNTAASAHGISEILQKLEDIERTALVAKLVREEVARTLAEERRHRIE